MRVVRWLGVVGLTVLMGWSPVMLPEHAHESDDDHDTHHVLVHWHAEGHFEGSHTADHPELGEGASKTLSLDAPFMLPPPTLERSVPVSTAAIVLDEPPVPVTRRVVADDVELLIHGPPRAPTGLRAPPSTSRL